MAAAAVTQSGTPIPASLRSFFEPRFGRSFAEVRVHCDATANAAAEAIGARAYTLGDQIAFASGEFAPNTAGGRRLIAHELAHVTQRSPSGVIHRTVNQATSNCPANVGGAGADPLADLVAADERAQVMALGTSLLLDTESVFVRDAVFGPGDTTAAYRRRFGAPAAVAGGFRNLFTGATLATENDALSAEMSVLSTRLAGVHRFLSRAVRYRCPNTATITVGGCTAPCAADDFAWTCTPTDARTIVICPLFWTLATTDERAAVLLHEAVHAQRNVAPHGSGSRAARARNAECFEAFVADLYGFVTEADSCPALP